MAYLYSSGWSNERPTPMLVDSVIVEVHSGRQCMVYLYPGSKCRPPSWWIVYDRSLFRLCLVDLHPGGLCIVDLHPPR